MFFPRCLKQMHVEHHHFRTFSSVQFVAEVLIGSFSDFWKLHWTVTCLWMIRDFLHADWVTSSATDQSTSATWVVQTYSSKLLSLPSLWHSSCLMSYDVLRPSGWRFRLTGFEGSDTLNLKRSSAGQTMDSWHSSQPRNWKLPPYPLDCFQAWLLREAKVQFWVQAISWCFFTVKGFLGDGWWIYHRMFHRSPILVGHIGPFFGIQGTESFDSSLRSGPSSDPLGCPMCFAPCHKEAWGVPGWIGNGTFFSKECPGKRSILGQIGYLPQAFWLVSLKHLCSILFVKINKLWLTLFRMV